MDDIIKAGFYGNFYLFKILHLFVSCKLQLFFWKN